MLQPSLYVGLGCPTRPQAFPPRRAANGSVRSGTLPARKGASGCREGPGQGPCVGDPFWGRSGVVGGDQAHREASRHVGTARSSLERLSYRGTLGGECRGVRGSSGRCQVRHLTPCPDGHAADGGQRRWWVPLLHPPCQSGGGLVRCISQRTQRWEFSSFVVLVGQHDGL